MKKNTVRVFNQNRKCVYEAQFTTADQAYKSFIEMVESARRLHERVGRCYTIIRYNEDTICSLEEIK